MAVGLLPPRLKIEGKCVVAQSQHPPASPQVYIQNTRKTKEQGEMEKGLVLLYLHECCCVDIREGCLSHMFNNIVNPIVHQLSVMSSNTVSSQP